MDEHTIKYNIETRINKEKVKNMKHIVPPNPKEKQGTSSAESPILLRREIHMAWGTTTDSYDSRNQSFPICNINKMSNTKGSYLVPYSGQLKQILVVLSNLQLELIILPQQQVNNTSILYIMVLDLFQHIQSIM